MTPPSRTAVAATIALFLGWLPSAAARETSPLVARGKILYQANCQACHGPTGRGDGPNAPRLGARPADLTQLSQTHGGVFPRDWVYSAIDGRTLAAVHRRRDMPVWGLSLRETGSDADQIDMVRGRILQLVSYLESLQAPSPDK